MLSYEYFIELVAKSKETLKNRGISIKLKTVNKVNYSYLALCFRFHNGIEKPTISPCIPMDQLYQKFLSGSYQEEEIIEFLLEEFQSFQNFEENESFTADSILGKQEDISFKLINTAENQALLKDLPHREVLDLSLIYYIETVGFGHSQKVSINITKELMALMGISSEEELHEIAKRNMLREDNILISSLGETLCGMVDADIPDDILHDTGMLVLSAKNYTFGASVLAINEVLKKCFDIYHCGFYILPSSIYEVLAVPEWKNDAKTLADMVKDVNREQVDLNERLSNNIYHFNMEQGLTIALMAEEQAISAY